MSKLTKEDIDNWVVTHNGESFTFDQLRASFNTDYEELRDCFFEALSDDKANFKQYFDELSKTIKFVKVSK